MNQKYMIIFLCILILCSLSCAKRGQTADIEDLPLLQPVLDISPVPDPLRVRALEIASSMETSFLAAQVLISGIDGRGSLPIYITELLKEIPAGGVMLFSYNLNTDKDSISSMLDETSSLIKDITGISPFMAVDLEGGYVNRFHGNSDLAAAGSLPAAASYFELLFKISRDEILFKIETDSYNAGREVFELGVNMNFAPVAEHLTSDNSYFLRNRSYGSDIFFTALAASAFRKGMEDAGVLCVVKHFPGSAGIDPHYAASVLDLKKTDLDTLVYPFSFLIEDGARAIMAAHTLTPAVDDKIASFSSAVMETWLRNELGFDGIIIADDFIMAAAGDNKPQDAAVLSIAAGADMILIWPAHLKATHKAILDAVENGSLSQERLADAVSRIIYEKLRMGLVDER